jgi:hypothetical protein
MAQEEPVLIDSASYKDGNNDGYSPQMLFNDSDEVSVYDFDQCRDVNFMKQRFLVNRHRCILFKQARFSPDDIDSSFGEISAEEKRLQEDLIQRSTEMLHFISVGKDYIKQLLFEGLTAYHGPVMVDLFAALARGEYPSLTVLSIQFFALSRPAVLGLVAALSSPLCKLQQFSFRMGNINILDDGYVRADSLQYMLMKAIVANPHLQKVDLLVSNLRENVFKEMNKFGRNAINNSISTLRICDAPGVAAVSMGWLRCFRHLHTLALDLCRLKQASFNDLRDRAVQFLPSLVVLRIRHNLFSYGNRSLNAKRHSVSHLKALQAVFGIRSVVEFSMSFEPHLTTTSKLKNIVELLESKSLFRLNGLPAAYYRGILNERQLVCLLENNTKT